MKIRHQIEAPELVEETKGLVKRIRENPWTPFIMVTVVNLTIGTMCMKRTVTVNIYNQTGEEI